METRKKYPLPNIIFILSLSLICIFYFVYLHNLVPAKFYLDSTTIMSGINNPGSLDASYRSAANFFRFLGVSANSPVVYLRLIAWSIFQLFLLFVLRINKNKTFSIVQFLFISFFAFMYGVYFNTLSKDLILLFILLIFLHFYINNNNFNYLILFIGLYTIFFRGYWIILFIFSLFIKIMKKILIRKMILYILLFFIITIIIYDLFNGNFITNAREHANIFRINSPDAKSMINNLLPNTNILNDMINYIYGLITLIIPIQGIHSFNVIIYYLWIISLITLILKNKNNMNKKVLLLLFVYINMQALFEPDLGSAFRHQLALFPLIYYLLNNIKIKEKRN